jgi:hypothetical protein
LGEIVIAGQDFGQATESDQAAFLGTPFDGVFGLAFPELAKAGTVSALRRLCTQHLIPQCLFGVWLTEYTRGIGGELHLGEIDGGMFLGELHWVPVSNRPYWQIDAERIWFDGHDNMAEDIQVLLDTGSSIISVPPLYIKKVDQILGVQEYINGYGLLSCLSIMKLPALNIQINGKVANNNIEIICRSLQSIPRVTRMNMGIGATLI